METSNHLLIGETLESPGWEQDGRAEESDSRQVDDALPREDPYADCPFWVREELPERFRAFRGIQGLEPELRQPFESWLNGAPNSSGVAGVDLYQANHFLPFRSETAAFLYENYTPLGLEWPEDHLPALRQAALRSVEGAGSPEGKVRALLETLSWRLLHPCAPPMGDMIPGDRNLNEDELLLSGMAWCNEQARVLVRACQAVGVPARLIYFFYANVPSGHTVVEFFDGFGWCLVDATYFLIFPGADGRPLSAATCHDRGEGQRRCQKIYREASGKIVAIGEKMLSKQPDRRVEDWVRTHSLALQGQEMQLHSFAVMNYPLPPSGRAGEDVIASSTP